MPPAGRIEGRYPDQAMHALFGLKIAVGIVAVHFERNALYAGFLAVQIVYHLYGIAHLFAVTGIHAVKQAYPVLRLGSASARMQAQHGIIAVIWALQQRLKLQRLYVLFKRGKLALYLRHKAFVVFLVRHFNQRFKVLAAAHKVLIFVQLGAYGLHAAVHLVRVFNIVPEAFLAHFGLQLFLFLAQ